jgi:surface antigen
MSDNPNYNSIFYNKPNNPFEKGQCTWFAYGRALELTGTAILFSQSYGRHGKNWISLAQYVTTGTVPMANSIAVWRGDSLNPYGHVAYVEEVVGDICKIRETNVSSSGKDMYSHHVESNGIKPYSLSNMTLRGKGVGQIIGYIYLNPFIAHEFWRKEDPLYADKNSSIENPNFDAQFKIKNVGNRIITVKSAAIAVETSQGQHLFDLKPKEPALSDTLIPPGTITPVGLRFGYIQTAGDYQVSAKINIDGSWHTLETLKFKVNPARAVKN